MLKLSLLAAMAGVTLISTAVAADVQYYLAVKGLSLLQTNSGPPLVVTNESPFRFVAEVLANGTNSVTNVIVALPSKKLVTLTNMADDEDVADFVLEQGFTNKTQLDANYKAGAFKFIIKALNDGSNSATLTLPKDLYPVAPHIANWADAQEIESKLPFVIRWDAITNLGVNDLVLLNVEETNGSPVLSSPGFFQPGALNGTNLFVEIPLNALDEARIYNAQLLVVKVAVRNTNTVPGTIGIGGYFRQTKFPLVTLSEPSSGGRVQFSSLNYSASKNDSAATVTVTRVGEESDTISVNLATSNGTAADGTNYSGVNTTLTFDSGLTSTNILIPLFNDYKLTGNKTVNLALSSLVGNAVFGNRSNSVLTIVDSQKAAAGTLQFAPSTYSVSEGVATVNVIVTHTGGTAGVVGVNFHTVDGSAQAGADYVATNGTLVFTSPKTKSLTIPIRILNDSLNETNETFFIALDATTGGAARGTNLTAKVTLLDNDPAGVINLGSATYATNENNGFFLVSVKRTGTGALASDVTVDFTTQNGVALAGLDYVATNGTLTFGSNELTKTIAIAVLNDNLAEGNESFAFKLSNVQGGGTLGAITNATLTILDDESSIGISSATYTVSEAGTNIAITLVRSGPLTATGSVNFATVNGTASAGSDYVATNGTATFAANIGSKTILVPIINDSIIEPNETFSFRLSNPQGALLGTITNAVVTITNDDFAGVFKFSAATYSGSEGATVNVSVQRTGGTANGVTVQFNMANGTASTGDYANLSQLLTFVGGETNKTIAIALTSDFNNEGAETVNLSLVSPSSGATLGTPNTATLTINNVAPTGNPFFFKCTTSPGGAFVTPLAPTFTDRLSGVFSLSVGNANNSLLAIGALGPNPTSASSPTRTVFLSINSIPNNPVLPYTVQLTDGNRQLIYQEQTTKFINTTPPSIQNTVKQWITTSAVVGTATITEYDRVTKIVAGTFSGTSLPIDSDITDNAATGTCNITSGSFRVKAD
jgi:hypothetical protein